MKKVLTRLILLSLLAMMCVLAFSGCDLFSDYGKGKRMLKAASNKDVTKTLYSKSDGITGSDSLTTYMRDGDIIYVYVEPAYENSKVVESTSWYVKEGDTYSIISNGEKTATTQEEYDKVYSYTTTGDLVSELEFFSSDSYSFGFLTQGNIKYFRVIYNERMAVASFGFQDSTLVYKLTRNGTFQFSYDAQTMPLPPNV